MVSTCRCSDRGNHFRRRVRVLVVPSKCSACCSSARRRRCATTTSRVTRSISRARKRSTHGPSCGLALYSRRKSNTQQDVSCDAIGRYTGNGNTNGFAEPSLWRFHTIWPFDNHEDHLWIVYPGEDRYPIEKEHHRVAALGRGDVPAVLSASRLTPRQSQRAARTSSGEGMSPRPSARGAHRSPQAPRTRT